MNVSFYSIAFEIQYSARLRFIFKFSINRCNISTHPFWSSLLLQSSSLCRPIGSIWNTWQLQDITVLWKCTTFAILHRRLYLKKYNKVLCKKEGLFTCALSAPTTSQYLTCFETRVYSVHLAKRSFCADLVCQWVHWELLSQTPTLLSFDSKQLQLFTTRWLWWLSLPEPDKNQILHSMGVFNH